MRYCAIGWFMTQWSEVCHVTNLLEITFYTDDGEGRKAFTDQIYFYNFQILKIENIMFKVFQQGLGFYLP